MQQLRDGLASSINAGDLAEIMATQVAKAKSGDVGAANFVFNQAHRIMSATTPRGPSQVVQNNNFFDAETRPDTPAINPVGTPSRVRKMAARASMGLPTTSPHDRDPRVVSDEEEKELRHRQQREQD